MCSTKKMQKKTLPSIFFLSQSWTPIPPMDSSAFLTTELKMLMGEVARLREETKTIVCKCNDPNCPFNVDSECENEFEEDEKQSPDLGFGSMEALDDCKTKRRTQNQHRLSMPPLQLVPPPPSYKQRISLSRNSTSLTSIPRGMQRRADGTILEFDYPGSREKRERKNGLTSGFSMSHLNRLDVYFDEEMEEDCQVDQDGLTSQHDYMFSRLAPERQILRNCRKDSNGNKKEAVRRESSTSSNSSSNSSTNSTSLNSTSLNSTSPYKDRRISDGTVNLTMARHSSADVILRHAGSTTAIDNDRLSNFVRLKNFQMKRLSALSS